MKLLGIELNCKFKKKEERSTRSELDYLKEQIDVPKSALKMLWILNTSLENLNDLKNFLNYTRYAHTADWPRLKLWLVFLSCVCFGLNENPNECKLNKN